MSMHPPQPDELGAQTRLDIRPTPWPWGPALVVLAVLVMAVLVVAR